MQATLAGEVIDMGSSGTSVNRMLWLLCAVPLMAAAQAPEPQPATTVLELCDWGTSERYEPQQLVSHFRQTVAKGPTAAVVTELRALLAHRCLALAKYELNEAIPDDPYAVLDWFERGGNSWLYHVVGGGGGARFRESPRQRKLVLPPSFRPWLDGAGLPATHPLKSVVCPASEASCGLATAGWQKRRDRFERKRFPICGSSTNYRAFLRCVHTHLPGASINPGGRFRAPEQGTLHWAAVGGGSPIWTFDLATGRAMRLISRDNRVLGSAARQTRRFEVGTVPVDNLREAALALILSRSRVDVARGHIFKVPVPKVPLQVDLSEPAKAEEGVGSGGYGARSRGLRHSWSYLPDGTHIAVRLPLETAMQSSTGRHAPHADAHALMGIALLGFEPQRRVALSSAQRDAVWEAVMQDQPKVWGRLLRTFAGDAQ
jgi:hypothetical protein